MTEAPFTALRQARLLRRLSAGPVTDSWLYEAPEGRLVLRRDRPLAARLGLDRKNEWKLLGAMATAGLGPMPVAVDTDRGLLLTRHIDRPVWAAKGLENPEYLHALGRLLRRVHEAPPVGKAFEPAGIAVHYAAQLPAGIGNSLADEAATLASALYPAGDVTCPCHHDAHAGNLVGHAPARLIDWEYAAMGQPWMDFAVVARFHQFDSAQLAGIAEGWCDDRGVHGVETGRWAGYDVADVASRVQPYFRLYDILATLWEQVVNGT
ncbi:phosphotransferase [Marinihelvus fidelis]|uniref:phosphotransferase n=1 Tax=Marinihelvus fidelis TaxID=2613842 RepID=UPI001782E252|nr:phosphotransferase [Marinihelvus fidelis]